MSKRILIIEACGSVDEPHECNGLMRASSVIRD